MVAPVGFGPPSPLLAPNDDTSGGGLQVAAADKPKAGKLKKKPAKKEQSLSDFDKAKELMQLREKIAADARGEIYKELSEADATRTASEYLKGNLKRLDTDLQEARNNVFIIDRRKEKEKEAQEGKVNAKGELSFHYIKADEVKTPAAGLKVVLGGTMPIASALRFAVDAELSGGRSAKFGEGTLEDTALFGPGPKGKLNNNGFGLSNITIGVVSGDNEAVERSKITYYARLAYGVVESWYYPEPPLKMFLSAIKLPGIMDTQQGVTTEVRTPLIGNFIQVGGGATYGSAIDNLGMFTGDFNFVRHEEGEQKGEPVKQLDAGLFTRVFLGEKHRLAASYHYVKTYGDRETYSHAFDIGARLAISDVLSAGVDVRLNPTLNAGEGQNESSSNSIALQGAYTIGNNTFILSGGLHTKTVSRKILPNNVGAPTVGTPESAVTTTTLKEIGLTYDRGKFSARVSYIDVPGGDGVAFGTVIRF